MNKKMKYFFKAVIVFASVVALAACGAEKKEAENKEAAAPAPSSKAAAAIVSESAENAKEETSEKAPSGINEDGRGDDPDFGEGIGEVVALTPEEESYMLVQTTDSWLKMSKEQKDELVVLVGRSLEDINGFVVPDYDDLVVMLDRQMEQYFKNGVNEGVLATVCDICGVAIPTSVS